MNRTVPHQITLTILLSLSVLAHNAKTEAPLPHPMPTEVELSAEEQKLSRKERNALIKKRSKAATEKPESSAVFYNLSADIGEQNNLFAKHPEIVAKLKKQLEDFHQEFHTNKRPAGVANQP